MSTQQSLPPNFDENYFRTHTYETVSFARFGQYWWSNRFYASLARRYGVKGLRLLEVGCGLGHLIGQLEVDFKTCALDINPWALKDAQQVTLKTDLQAASAEDLPYASEIFGVVIIKHIVEHLPYPEKAIFEITRVLKPGGLLIFSTPNLDSLLKPLKGDRWIGYLDPTHISLKSPDKWIGLIRSTGMNIKRVFSDGFWDVPYIPWVPVTFQKLIFGSLGGFQAITTLPFLPLRWGESIIVIAYKQE